MKLITSKTPLSDIQNLFNGGPIMVSGLIVDNALRHIEFLCGETGESLIIKQASGYSENIIVLVQPALETVEKFAVRGTFFGNDFERVFDERYQAEDLRNRMQARTDEADVCLEVVPVTVVVRSVP